MAKWIDCKQCGHKYRNSIKRCPNCFAKTPITARTFLAAIPITVVILSAIVLPIVALCNNQPQPKNGTITTAPVITTTQTESAITTTPADTVTTARPSSTSSSTIITTTTTAKYRQPTDNDDNVVIGNDGIAKVTMPKWLLLLTEPNFNYQLTEQEKTEYRFTHIQKNADGSATYTIDQNDFHHCRLILTSNANGLISGLEKLNTVSKVDFTYGQYNTVKVHTTHATAVQVKTDTALAQSVVAAGLLVTVVQHFDIDQNIGCTFEIHDTDDTLLATSKFPDILLK